MTTTKQKKNSKIRHLEYYDLQNTLDTLYADSGRGNGGTANGCSSVPITGTSTVVPSLSQKTHAVMISCAN